MKILFIQTGGTIDKDYPKLTKGYAFEISTPAVERILKNTNPTFEYEILNLLQKDSLEINDQDRILIKDACINTDADYIIITHGTDTMIDTAHTLSDINNKVVVLTGAMRPERFSNSDASFNLGVAIGAINSFKQGIYIAMNGQVLKHNDVKRDLTTGQFLQK